MCEFDGCCWEEVIPASLWRRLLERGRELDLNRGGLWDSRLGAINLWASPEDRPEGWEEVEITKGALNHPRSYVAGFYGEYLEGEKLPDEVKVVADIGWLPTWPPERLGGPVRVHLVIAPYDKMRQVFHKEWDRPEKYASEKDKKWCLRKWEDLKDSLSTTPSPGEPSR